MQKILLPLAVVAVLVLPALPVRAATATPEATQGTATTHAPAKHHKRKSSHHHIASPLTEPLGSAAGSADTFGGSSDEPSAAETELDNAINEQQSAGSSAASSAKGGSAPKTTGKPSDNPIDPCSVGGAQEKGCQ